MFLHEEGYFSTLLNFINTMPLCKPLVSGPLSELSKKIRVQGQLSGSTVTIFSLPTVRKIAEGVATSGDQYFDLLSSEELLSNDSLVAMQQFGGEKSEMLPDDIGMGIQPGPNSPDDLGIVGFKTHLYECGQFIWIEGAIPGAMVEVIVGNLILGTAQAMEGFARMPINTISTKRQSPYEPISLPHYRPVFCL